MLNAAQILIVGAGITGLTIARELLSHGAENILIIEKETTIGHHASGRNSGVLHAGIYYHSGSLKAKYCLEGNRLMKAYCREKGLPLRETGKVVVTKDPSELPTLFELKRRADQAGAKAEIVDAHQLGEIEPNARTVEKALYSPETAIIDPMAVLTSLESDLQNSGLVRILYGTIVRGFGSANSVKTNRGTIQFEKFVNAAGAHADRIAHQAGLARTYCSLPFKGTYLKMASQRVHLLRGNIYPVPDLGMPFLGVHFTRSIHDEVYVGPTAVPALSRENYRYLQGLDREIPKVLYRMMRVLLGDPQLWQATWIEGKKLFTSFVYHEASQMLSGLQRGDLLRCGKVGIRPQLVDMHTGKLVMDFVVIQDGDGIHVLNVISPGFTSSMAFARMVVDRLMN